MKARLIKEITGDRIDTIPAGTEFEIEREGELYSCCSGLGVNQVWKEEYELIPEPTPPALNLTPAQWEVANAYLDRANKMGFGPYFIDAFEDENSIAIFYGQKESCYLFFAITVSDDGSKYVLTMFETKRRGGINPPECVDRQIAEAPTNYFHLIFSKWFDIILKDTVENVHQSIALAEIHEVNPAEESY